MKNIWLVWSIVAIQILSGCQAYKRDIMLQFDERFDAAAVEKSVDRAAQNYIIRPGDYIRLDVFTNDGERLIDPNFELMAAGANNQQMAQMKDRFVYLVMEDGTCRIPKIGTISLEGLTINEAEELLQESYDDYYKESFVKIRPANRRAVVLGGINGMQARGAGGLVVPLDNENMTILEVLALAGGVEQGGKVSSIKLIRGSLNEPKVYDIDLSTIAGMKQSGMIVESGDVIYVEPWRRPFRETVRDVSPILSVITSVTTLVFVIQNSNNPR
jgi:polysaccharide export outer membrane protein